MEVWKPIPNYEGLYEASSFGRIRTAEGKTTSSARFEKRVWKQRILKEKTKLRGNHGTKKDARVELWKNGEHKTHLVSRLVASAFYGEKEGMTVNHIDGNTTNNSVENLEWCSIRENIQKGFSTGLFDNVMKSVYITDVETGERYQFKSMSECSRSIGRSVGYISGKLIENKNAFSSLGKEYIITLVDYE